jgi:hypothetical protein
MSRARPPVKIEACAGPMDSHKSQALLPFKMILTIANTLGWVVLFVNWFVEAQEREKLQEAYNARGREIAALKDQLADQEEAAEETTQELEEEYEEKMEALKKELLDAEVRAERDRKEAEVAQVNLCLFLFLFGVIATVMLWLNLLMSSPLMRNSLKACA